MSNKFNITGEPREKPQGVGVFTWASLEITQKFQIETPTLILCFLNFCLSEEVRVRLPLKIIL